MIILLALLYKSYKMNKLIPTLLVAFTSFWLMMDKADDFNFDSVSGLNVLITGASSGIGEEIAYAYAKHGANVVIVARREAHLRKVIEKCRALSPNPKSTLSYLAADLGDIEQAQTTIQSAVKTLGGLDHLILNHALLKEAADWDGSKQNLTDHDDFMRINYQSFVHLASHALPHLIKSNGAICISGSTAGRTTAPYMNAYSASKYALDGFFGSLRWEYRIRKINVSITYAIIGRIGTESEKNIMGSYFDKLVDKETMDRFMPPHSVEETARALIKATTSRENEIYYPPRHFLYLQSVLRIMWPELLQMGMDAQLQS